MNRFVLSGLFLPRSVYGAANTDDLQAMSKHA